MTVFAHDTTDRPGFILISSDEDPSPPWLPFLDAPRNDSLCIELRSRTAGSQNRWAARLDQTVGSARAPVVLVAHGASCVAVAWWARLSPSGYVAPVAGAIFLAPSDPYGADSRSPFRGPPTLLPFPSVMVPREGDDGVAAALARSWGSRLVDAGAPTGSSEGPGIWRARERLLAEALATILAPETTGPAYPGSIATGRTVRTFGSSALPFGYQRTGLAIISQ